MDNLAIAFLIVTLAVALAAIAIVIRSSKKADQKSIPNYKALFILGITWLPIGFVNNNPGLWSMGLVFMIVGLVKTDLWGQETKWADLPQATKRIKLALIAVSSIALIFGLLYVLVMRS